MSHRRRQEKAQTLALLILFAAGTLSSTAEQLKPSAAINDLGRMSDGVEAVTDQTLRCVVKITADTYMPDQGYYDEGAKESSDAATATQTEGSGILVSSDGYIVTNAHVVSGERNLRVILHPAGADIEVRGAKVIGIDKATDLAVLRIAMDKLPFIHLDDRSPAKQGEIALAFGDPFGMDRTVTMGIVSAVDRQLAPDDPRLWIQTDAAVNPGNSGGPLVDARGRLLGINTVIYNNSGDEGNAGVALAIPASTVRQVFHDLVAYGHVNRVSLGVSPLALTPGIATALHLNVQSGILIEDVNIGGPAEQAGMKPGDVLLSLDGQPAATLVAYSKLLNTFKPDAGVKVSFLRANQLATAEITPQIDDDDPLPLAARVNARANLVRRLEILGLTLDADAKGVLGPTRYPQGVVVAARSSTLRISSDTLQVHDIIYQVNGTEVKDVESLREALRSIPGGTPLVLQIERDHSLYYLPLGAARH
jgi:S1-C subfamily serine protease